MLGKSTKKDSIHLKFDTSSDNLACFIRSNSKIANENGCNDRQARSNRKKIKSKQQKASTFKNEDFLQSILVNAFTQEFACAEDIKKLVNNIQFCSEEQLSPQPKINCLTIKNPKNQKKKIPQEDNYKVILQKWIENPKDQGQIKSTFGTEQTPQKSKNQSNVYSQSSSFGQNLVLPYQSLQRFQFTSYYDQNYYLTQQQYITNQDSQRKKRNFTNQQPKQFRIQPLNIEQDGRTTLMIRNIPNKYTQQLLLEQFNKNFKFKFDFFYLPIDYNNACNVGYAFINFIHAKFILPFYNDFNGKKWTRFNSEKICSLTYARIQGTGALRSHFKNSHVMLQKDKRFKPLLNQVEQQSQDKISKVQYQQNQNYSQNHQQSYQRKEKI